MRSQAAIQPQGGWPWIPDRGDGTYHNPIICSDYSDPDVIRHGDDFYLTASSFHCTPGLPILHSRDLVNWRIISHALKNLPHSRYTQVQHGCGVWAPAIRFHNGKFWIFFPTPDEGIYVTTAEHTAGPWSEPHLVQSGKGLIDPCPLWDDDGQAYLVHAYSHSRAGICDRLRVCPMAADGSRLLGEGKFVFHEPAKHPTLEGPKFLKREGYYYILAPAGGVPTGWQVALRSRHIYGPYEDHVVLRQGRTSVNGPHQGALVDTPCGEWWFVHFQDAGVYGRVVHLQPVSWTDGWPLMGEHHDNGGIGEPVSRHHKPSGTNNQNINIPQTSDEFEGPKLGLQWQWQGNHQDNWFSLEAKPGSLRLFSRPLHTTDLAEAPNLLLQKLSARTFKVETQLNLVAEREGEEAGLAVIGRTNAAVAVRRVAQGHQIVYRENGEESLIQTTHSTRLRIQVLMREGGQCSFSFAANEKEFVPLSMIFQATAGIWVGAKVGIYCIGRSGASAGYADFDYFRFTPPEL